MKPNQITLTQEDLRVVGRWAADCAERVLPLFVANAPSDRRPREAIAGLRVFVRGSKRTARLRSLALAALAAAREVNDPAATAAARAAGFAAASAFTHATVSRHQEKHVLGPAVYAALARELSIHNSPIRRAPVVTGRSAGEKEIRWAIQRASPAVRKIVRRMPIRVPGRTRLNALYYQLDTGLRNESIINKKPDKTRQPKGKSAGSARGKL